MKAKKAQDSLAINTEIILPNDTNVLGNLMGGRLLHWMDICAAVAAHRHCGRVVVTKISRSFYSSMEVFIDVWVENNTTGEKRKCNEAIYTFVAVDQLGNPINVPELIPETDEEKQRFDGALRRKQLSLILAGKMKPEEATELKALFI